MGAVTCEGLGNFSLADARNNMEVLSGSPYSGSLVAVGVNPEGEQLHIVTALMGNNDQSKACQYVSEGDSVFSKPFFGEAADPLMAYRSMARFGDWHVATNGDQTDNILAVMALEGSTGIPMLSITAEALLSWRHKPDALHTPRINAVVGSGILLPEVPTMLSVIRNNPEDPEKPTDSVHRFYRGDLRIALQEAGVGLCLTTYEGNTDLPVPFEGGPRPIVIGSTAEETGELIGEALNASGCFWVAAATKAINLKTGRVEAGIIHNQYLSVGSGFFYSPGVTSF